MGMTEEQHLLVILAEECAEVAHRASKAIRFGMDEVQPGQKATNRERLEEELADLRTAAELLALHVEFSVEKAEKINKFMAYARERGTL
jgi:NTP pyrophosphatase (non-canonical NTP hydrolase)